MKARLASRLARSMEAENDCVWKNLESRKSGSRESRLPALHRHHHHQLYRAPSLISHGFKPAETRNSTKLPSASEREFWSFLLQWIQFKQKEECLKAELNGAVSQRSSLLLKDFSTLDIKDDEKPKCGKKKSGCVVQMAHFSVLFFGMDQHHRGGRLPLLQIPIPEIPPPTQKLPRHHTAMSKINPEVFKSVPQRRHPQRCGATSGFLS
ncbi:hypothetical protein EV1_035173 [Malus domestica]